VKPVAIFRHSPTEGPGYFAAYLDRRGIPWQLVHIDENETVPGDATRFSGLAFMGGPMSVNDDLPWLAPEFDLIRAAVARDVPVLGHCLGGQLMARALGGVVSRTPLKEIGWGEVKVGDDPVAQAWFGADRRTFVTFHWHGETFSNPAGSRPVLSSPWCMNQGFAIGPHLAMQCHIEMTEELVESWCETGQREIARGGSPAVQPPASILRDLPLRVQALHRVADAVYARWVEGLKG
jgi:GMP synthase-like glutamine amidotransferase